MQELTQSFATLAAGRHPAFCAPRNAEARIWRYLDFPKLVWFLDSQRLAMPHCRMMEDPFEGTTPEGLLRRLEARIEAASEAARQTLERNLGRLRELAADLKGGYFISSWHMNDVESEAMWKLFSSPNDGVALVSTYARLRAALPDYVGIGLVRYIDYTAETLPGLDMFHWVMHKRKSFEHEREIRAVASWHTPDEFGGDQIRAQSDAYGYYPRVDVAALVTSVYVHPLAQDWFVDLVRRIVVRFEFDFPVYRSELSAKPLF
ncbi:MAG TPA: hypothetical protein VF342_01030 [Alphaproteobacteria bacterium]